MVTQFLHRRVRILRLAKKAAWDRIQIIARQMALVRFQPSIKAIVEKIAEGPQRENW
jgi:hypothetical protein